MNMFTTQTPRRQGRQNYFGFSPKSKEFITGSSWRFGALVVKSFRILFVFFLVFSLCLTPRMIQAAFAAEAPAAESDEASQEEIQAVQQLAKNGYLGEKKESILAAKTLTEDDVTDAVIKANDSLTAVDVKALKPGSYRVEDLQSLLSLLKDKTEDIRTRKLSAWKYQNKLQKMITALSQEPEGAVSTDPVKKAAETAVAEAPKAEPTFTPVPGPSREEFSGMKEDVKDLTKKVGELQADFDKKIDTLQKSGDEMKASNLDVKNSNAEIKTAQAELQEQLKLVKRLLDRVQDDLKKTDDHLDEVAKKAAEKSMTDVELQQELNIMHKDLRDNTQDVSILKQQVAKLDKSGEKVGESPLDSALSSKWLSGGALLVGIAALVISLTKK